MFEFLNRGNARSYLMVTRQLRERWSRAPFGMTFTTEEQIALRAMDRTSSTPIVESEHGIHPLVMFCPFCLARHAGADGPGEDIREVRAQLATHLYERHGAQLLAGKLTPDGANIATRA